MDEKLQHLAKLCGDVIECIEGMKQGDTGDSDLSDTALRTNIARIEAQLRLIYDQFNRFSCNFDDATRDAESKIRALEERINLLCRGAAR